MENIFKETIKLLGNDEKAVWAAVVEQQGSTPRKSAARMLISSKGDIWGSVGGGRLEAEVMETAAGLFENPGRTIVDISLTGREVAQTDMICGGKTKILVETLEPEQIGFVENLQSCIVEKKKVFLLTELSSKGSFEQSHFILDPENIEASVKGLPASMAAGVEALLEPGGISEDSIQSQRAGGLFLESLSSPPVLHIFGGGHISLDLAWFAHRIGFHVVVIDDREEYACRQRFPMAAAVRAMPYKTALEQAEFGENDYVVIVTRGHLYDLDVLREVVQKTPRYIGMIGSRRKKRMIYDHLMTEGISKEVLERVHAPIGLNIGAETPAEISVSIVGELIHVLADSRNSIKKEWHV